MLRFLVTEKELFTQTLIGVVFISGLVSSGQEIFLLTKIKKLYLA